MVWECFVINKIKKEVKHWKKLLNLFVVLIIEKSFVLRCNKI
jgi:hypothetical protein